MKNTMVSTLYLHALTLVHAGTGQTSASAIDLPVAREKATHWPVLPATGLKGVFCEHTSNDQRERLFGSSERQGALQFGDGRLLCFPVRAWQGVFAYVSCPLALNRFRRDFLALGAPVPFAGAVPDVAAETALLTPGSILAENGTVWLEDLALPSMPDAAVQAIAAGIAGAVFPESERAAFVSRFALLSDDVFDFFACTATEITARIKLKSETKTTQGGGLWYEESVPAEAVFVSVVRGGALPIESGTVVQVGGDESVGRGLCRVTVASHE